MSCGVLNSHDNQDALRLENFVEVNNNSTFKKIFSVMFGCMSACLHNIKLVHSYVTSYGHVLETVNSML